MGLDTKGTINNECDAWAAKAGIASFDLDNRLDQITVGTLGA